MLDFLKAAVTFFPVCAVFCKSVVFVEVHRRLRVSVKSVTQPIGISDGFGVIATAWRRSAAFCADVGPVWAGGLEAGAFGAGWLGELPAALELLPPHAAAKAVSTQSIASPPVRLVMPALTTAPRAMAARRLPPHCGEGGSTPAGSPECRGCFRRFGDGPRIRRTSRPRRPDSADQGQAVLVLVVWYLDAQ